MITSRIGNRREHCNSGAEALHPWRGLIVSALWPEPIPFLGGDNMDLALAYMLQARLEAEGKSLDAWQFLALVNAAAGARSPCSRTPAWRKRRSQFPRAAQNTPAHSAGSCE
jgi:hypothetical protein